MREGSYAQIRHGMRVVGRNGSTLGGVDQVLVDEGSDIFVGVTVRPDLFTQPLLVPGERIDRLREGVLHVDAEEAELEPYRAPEERHQQAGPS